MFTIGDKVAYPMHGAGVIEGIEEQTILGTPRRYYVLRLSHSDMKVMVPVETSQQVGVRYIVKASDLDDVVSVLHSDSTPMSDNWNKRNRDNMEKLKTGDLKEIAEVVRNLLRADHRKEALHRREEDAKQREAAAAQRGGAGKEYFRSTTPIC